MLQDTFNPPRSASRPRGIRGILWSLWGEFEYADPLDNQRARIVSILTLLLGLLGPLGTLGMIALVTGAFPQNLIAPNIVLSVIHLVVYWLARSGRLRVASILFVALTMIAPTLQGLLQNAIPGQVLLLGLGVPIVSAAFLIGPIWSLATALFAVVAGGVISVQGLPLSAITFADLQIIGRDASVAGFLLGALALFSWQLAQNLFEWAENAQRRARQLEAAALVSQTAAIAPNVTILLTDVVDRIRDAFEFYHAQVFLIDQETQMARLEASTGRAGEALLARGHGLPVGSRSVIGQCTYSGRPVVINDVLADPMHRPNELLPDTRGELALPLLVGAEVLGALDVQSDIVNAFSPEDIRALQVMANQLAAAIEKGRLLDALQERAEENQRLLDEAQASLRQIEDLNRRLTREGWSDYLRVRRSQSRLGYTMQSGAVQVDTSWTAPMRQAYQGEQTVVIRQDRDAQIAAIPVRIRGEVIGVLEIQRDGSRPWTDDELEMAELLVDRLSLAIENARLFESASLAAEREHTVNLIAQNIQAAGSIDEVLQTALEELGTVLGASRGVVQISPKDEPMPQTGPLRATALPDSES